MFEFEVTDQFLDALATIIPSAPIRLAFRELEIQRVLERILRAYRNDPTGSHQVLIDEEQGLFLTAPLPDAPECMVMFELDDPTLSPGSTVRLWNVREVHREATEDDS